MATLINVSSVLPVGASIQLSCSSEQGAVLILKEGALRNDSSKITLLGQELKLHYKTWYTFLCDTFGKMPLRNMVFVTGCDLTTDWATATFLDRARSGRVSFRVSDPSSDSISVALWGDWETSTSVPVRCGPSPDQKALHAKGEPKNNQCIFIRGWRVSERIKPLPLKIVAAAEPKDDRRLDGGDDDKMVSLQSIGETSPDDVSIGKYKKGKYKNKKKGVKKGKNMNEGMCRQLSLTDKNIHVISPADMHPSRTIYDEAFEKLLDVSLGTEPVLNSHILKFQYRHILRLIQCFFMMKILSSS